MGVVAAVLLVAYLISSLVHLQQSERVSLGDPSEESDSVSGDDTP